MRTRRKLLVLAVDRDDDIGRVGVQTPVVGEEAVLEAARKFGIARPEDSDLNVLYAAVHVARELRKRGHEVEVAIVSGDAYDTLQADLRIREQVEYLVNLVKPDGIVLVCDGREDEEVVPVIQSLAPIVSVKRVVVEQLRGVEETYILIGRYIKKVVMEPRLARVFLGYPGVLILSFALLAMLGLLHYALSALLIVVGVLMIVRGFELEEKILEVWSRNPIMLLAFIAATVSVAGMLGATVYTIQVSAGKPAHIVAAELLSSIAPLLGFGGLSIVTARIAVKALNRDAGVIGEIPTLVVVIVLVVSLLQVASKLRSLPATPTPTDLALAIVSSGFIITLLVGIAVIALLRVLTEVVMRRTSSPSSSSSKEL